MIPRTGFLLLFFLLVCLAGNAQKQKVKYKDLFLALNAKEYAKAEPFLIQYINENKTNENPNAFLFMGIIFYDKAYKADVLKELTKLNNYTDTALIFLEKARVTITEKEVKRNDDYYEMYRKRDLRTSESGIKLSDIQVDIDKRIKDLKDRKEKVRALNEYFTIAQTCYGKANEAYRKIQAEFPGQQEFYLQSDDNAIIILKRIIGLADSCARAFSSYKTTSALLGKTGYNQIFDMIEIKDLRRDGASLADFYDNDVKIWDYRKWASTSEEIFEKEIFPLRDGLINCDIDINKLQVKLKKDSTLSEDDLAAIFQRPLLVHLKKYDPDPLPIAVFKMKAAELLYDAAVIHTHKLKDSLDVTVRLQAAKEELRRASALDSLAVLLGKRDLSNDAVNYNHYITTIYGTKDVLKSLIRTTHDFASRQKTRKSREEAHRARALRWIFNAPDSIPLFIEAPLTPSKFKPLVVVPENYTIGIKYADSLSIGYFYSITPTRIPDIKALFKLPTLAFNKRNLPILKSIAATDEKGQVFYAMIYSEAKVRDRFTAVIAKIYRTDGLAWTRTYPLEMLPASLSFASDTGELSIKITSPSGDTKIVVVDKAGKQIQ